MPSPPLPNEPRFVPPVAPPRGSSNTDPTTAAMARELASVRQSVSVTNGLLLGILLLIVAPPLLLFGAWVVGSAVKPLAEQARRDRAVAEAKQLRDGILDRMEEEGFLVSADVEPDGRQALTMTPAWLKVTARTQSIEYLDPIWKADRTINGEGRTIAIYLQGPEETILFESYVPAPGRR